MNGSASVNERHMRNANTPSDRCELLQRLCSQYTLYWDLPLLTPMANVRAMYERASVSLKKAGINVIEDRPKSCTFTVGILLTLMYPRTRSNSMVAPV